MTPSRVAVLNVVGLTRRLLEGRAPRLAGLARQGGMASVKPAFPAVTCTAQANYLTGALPSAHGVVGNGWYHRELGETQFWRQSNALVRAPKVWERLRAAVPGLTCAQLFWWYNMYSTADYTITPRPLYPADGRKVFDIHTWPYSIRQEIQAELGPFPFPAFWGPAAGVASPAGGPDAVSQWIAESARWIERRHEPGLGLVYLPHLDYNLQRLGPGHPEIARDVERVDALAGGLADFFQERGVRVVVLSEYGVSAVDQPVHLNRLFREQGWLAIKEELGRERLECGDSPVFALADHQVAHVYIKDPALEGPARRLLEAHPGVARVLGAAEKRAWGIDHERAGDLVVVARERAWFTYYYWMDDARAPDFARTVDIHRKPGYDPAELFLDPELRAPRLKIAGKLLRKRLGMRMLMDVIPLDASLVKGSHGAPPEREADWPVILSATPGLLRGSSMESTDVAGVIGRAVAGGE